MKNLSRGAWLAVAAVAAIPATIAIAKTVDNAGWRMTPETRSRLEDGRLAMAKAALKLNADQEKLWAPVEQQVRDTFKAREERRAEREKKREERKAEKSEGGEHKRADLAARYEKISQRVAERADRLKAFSSAFTPFYASLSDEQKDVLRPLMRELSPGFGRHGRMARVGHSAAGVPAADRAITAGTVETAAVTIARVRPGMQDNGPDNDGGPADVEPDKKG